MLRSITRPRLRLAAAGLALCGGLAAASPSLAATSAPAATSAHAAGWHSPPSSTTFVVGSTDAVDTLNPFLGFTSQDYEVYGLLYDNLMDYGQLDYAGHTQAGDLLVALQERPRLDLPHQARREVVRRRPADRGRRGLHDPAQHPAELHRVRRQRGLRRRDHEREGDRQVHGRDDGEALHPGHEPARSCRSCPSTSGRTSARSSSARSRT